MNPLKSYLSSFRFRKEYWYTFLIDTVFLGIFVSALYLFGDLIKEKGELISQGKTPEQLQQILMSMQPEQLEVFLSNLKGFVLVFAAGAVITLVGGLLLYSLGQKLIWGYLREKKFTKTKYGKWNLVNLVLIIPVIIYGLCFGLAKLGLAYFVSLAGSQVVLEVFNNLMNLLFLLAGIIFVFLVYYSFAEKYKVWESMGAAFSLVKIKWKEIWPAFLFILGTAVVLSLALWPAGKLFAYQETVLLLINLIISLLFLAWMRLYVYRTVKE